MFPRRTIVTSGGTRREYIHLVESVRRKSDGRPVHKVIANLGAMDEVVFHNLKTAFEASRRGRRLPVVTTLGGAKPAAPKPQANLRYLDVAVADALWKEWGFDRILGEILPAGQSEVSGALVVEALSIQRLVAPASKLAAVRWLPTTALPELLGIAPAQFNNTRVHRVLDDLEAATPALTARLPGLCRERNGAFAALFLDVTDTWFVGRGPDIAIRAKTKEGMVQRKIGIVALCNERGYPLRWEVIPGSRSDSVAMTDMVRAVSGLTWVGDAPVVVDRAMGESAHIRTMASTKLRFLTALKTTEFSKYATGLPWAVMEGLPVEDRDPAQVANEAARRAEAAGMSRVDQSMLVLDVGVVTPDAPESDEPLAESSDAKEIDEDPNARALRLARQAQQALVDGRHTSHAAAGSALGLHRSVLKKYRVLLRLDESIQCDILDGSAAGLSLEQLLRIARIPEPQAQIAEFESLLRSDERRHSGQCRDVRSRRGPVSTSAEESEAQPWSVRVVAYFNPSRFVEQRRSGIDKLNRIHGFIDGINGNLAKPRGRRAPAKIMAEIDRRLHRDDMATLFKVSLEERDVDDRKCLQVSLALDEQEWRRRSRYDGFCVLVGHKDLPHAPADLCHLYRSKDMIEKDFQVIKSVVELRPVRHRTELKVRAHVTLCMLALIVERTLREKLCGASSPAQALELLGTCHLNLYTTEQGPAVYTVTQTDTEQQALLRKLRLLLLADDGHLSQLITPR